MNMKYIIAVDLGGTITKVGLLRNGELVDYVKMPSRQDLDMTASLPEIENAIDFLLNSNGVKRLFGGCLLYTSPSPRDISGSRMPSSA